MAYLKSWNDGFASFEAEAFRCGVFIRQERLEEFTVLEVGQHLKFFVAAKLVDEGGFNLRCDPVLLLFGQHVTVFDSYFAAVRSA